MTIYAFLASIQDQTPSGTPPSDPGAGATGAPGWWSFLPYVAIIAVFYFVMIMPERKARKKREAMLSAMKKGDRVMTSSGMYATIAAIEGDDVTLQIADGVRARFTRQSIAQVIEEKAEEKK
jgi:preprotein translocase subunit YajC